MEFTRCATELRRNEWNSYEYQHSRVPWRFFVSGREMIGNCGIFLVCMQVCHHQPHEIDSLEVSKGEGRNAGFLQLPGLLLLGRRMVGNLINSRQAGWHGTGKLKPPITIIFQVFVLSCFDRPSAI